MLLKRWFAPGDVDGFFALALENFIQVLLIDSLCDKVLGFPTDFIYSQVLPSVGLSVMLTNIFYGWQAYQQNRQQGREDFTALPSGINIISLLGHVFLVMLPVKAAAIAQGLPTETAVELSWHAGMVACFCSGVLKLLGLGAIGFLQRYIPIAANLASLAGIGLTFIAMGFVLRTFAYPVVSLVPLGVILLSYYGQIQFPLPGGLMAIVLGTALAWLTGLMHWDVAKLAVAAAPLGLYWPHLHWTELWQGRNVLVEYSSVIVPLAVFDFTSSLQSMESAGAEGDNYPSIPAMVAHGLGCMVGGICGSCFPVMIYIGHPGWKMMGARAGYSILSGLFAGFLGLSGSTLLLAYFIPIESGMAVFIAIGISIVAQSFHAVPSRHAPAVVVGLLPAIAAWGAMLAKTGLQTAGMGTPTNPFSADLIPAFHQNTVFIDGALALERGYILIALILSSITVYIIDRQFLTAAIWAGIAALLSWVGLIHSYRWTIADTVSDLHWGAGQSWATGYCLLAILLLYVHWQVKLFPRKHGG